MIRDTEIIDYDYKEQGEYLQELLEKKEIVENHKRMIERAKKIKPEAKEKLEKIDLNKQEIVTDEEFTNELSKIFTTKERSTMKLTKLDNYCLFIASRFLESLEDHQNFTKVTKKLKYNMEKYYYNPIPLNTKSIQLFPNISIIIKVI
jgi:hypothetical protein